MDCYDYIPHTDWGGLVILTMTMTLSLICNIGMSLKLLRVWLSSKEGVFFPYKRLYTDVNEDGIIIRLGDRKTSIDKHSGTFRNQTLPHVFLTGTTDIPNSL
jgi:hypothetical protein